MNPKSQMNIVITGHVDHGKSTVVGRLLADTGSLPEGKLAKIRLSCERNSKPFEYAFLLDALKEEQSQGITIDSARVFFKTHKRHYIIIDAPGHIEFLKNMISGAARAEAALLVIDAKEGIQENSRRHGYMLSMLGIRQITVLVNKMDLIHYDEKIFQNIVKEFSSFLKGINVFPAGFIPVSGFNGENITAHSANMPWYRGNTVLQALDNFQEEKSPLDQAFRMPVQGIYKFTKSNDDRRIVAGTVESGRLMVGDEVVFYPSGKKSTVKTIEAFNAPPLKEISTGMATGFTLKEQIYISRGEIACRPQQTKAEISSRFRASIFWLAENPMKIGHSYILKLGTARVNIRLESITRAIDSSSLSTFDKKNTIDRHDVAECILKTDRPLAYDLTDQIAATSRFVIVDGYEISGGGIIRETLDDQHEDLRNKVNIRNFKWETSFIPEDERTEKFQQKPLLLLISGKKETKRKELAKELERELFREGKLVYFLGMGNALHGIGADLGLGNADHEELLRRLGEISHIVLNMGAILIVSALSFTDNDLEVLRTTIDSSRIQLVWLGKELPANLSVDLHLPQSSDAKENIVKLKQLLLHKGFINKSNEKK